jgi:ribosomal protein L16 Arg81 hydroxylase
MTPPGLWDLIAPITSDDFLARYWNKAPLCKRSADRTAYHALFRVEQIDDLLQAAAGNASEFDYYAAGSAVAQADYTAEGNYVQLNRLLGLYAKGGTIHVSNIQKYVRSLGSFCRRAQNEFLVDCEADFWLTRANEFKPYLHFDRYDIFILQIHGRKRWRLFEPLPIPDNRVGAALAWEEVGEPIIDVVIEPGDLIYIPPHTPHVVTTQDEHSVHVGIGLHPLTWRQVLDVALDESRDRPNALSEILPLDFMHTLKREPAAMLQLLRERVAMTWEPSNRTP